MCHENEINNPICKSTSEKVSLERLLASEAMFVDIVGLYNGDEEDIVLQRLTMSIARWVSSGKSDLRTDSEAHESAEACTRAVKVRRWACGKPLLSSSDADSDVTEAEEYETDGDFSRLMSSILIICGHLEMHNAEVHGLVNSYIPLCGCIILVGCCSVAGRRGDSMLERRESRGQSWPLLIGFDHIVPSAYALSRSPVGGCLRHLKSCWAQCYKEAAKSGGPWVQIVRHAVKAAFGIATTSAMEDVESMTGWTLINDSSVISSELNEVWRFLEEQEPRIGLGTCEDDVERFCQLLRLVLSKHSWFEYGIRPTVVSMFEDVKDGRMKDAIQKLEEHVEWFEYEKWLACEAKLMHWVEIDSVTKVAVRQGLWWPPPVEHDPWILRLAKAIYSGYHKLHEALKHKWLSFLLLQCRSEEAFMCMAFVAVMVTRPPKDSAGTAFPPLSFYIKITISKKDGQKRMRLCSPEADGTALTTFSWYAATGNVVAFWQNLMDPSAAKVRVLICEAPTPPRF